MRIALVSREFPPATRSGGIGTYTEKAARALTRLGQEVHVFTEGDPLAPITVDGAAHLHVIPEIHARPDERRVVRRAFAVARALRRAGPFDVVQACEYDAEAVAYGLHRNGVLVTRLATPAYVVNQLNGMSTRARIRTAIVGRLERLQTRLSDRVISPSAALAEIVTRDWRLDPARVAVVPTGIEIPSASNAGVPPANVAGLRYLLYFGRLERRKGVKTLIDALPQVFERNPDVWAVFAGQDLGLGGTPVREYARRTLGVHFGRTVFLPRIPHNQLFPLIRAAALVVLPSIWENIANACLEAMALGRPVVATTGSGFAEIINDGVDGFLVPPGNHQEIARVATDALANPDRLSMIGRAARRRAGEFDLDKMAARMLEVYDEVIRSSRVHAAAEVGA